ncbi:hypothetical protein OKA05_14780 [Luteolibacter arcticus]|uniref:DUF304 domain-containing protein n=1 Tax=Luteolibacter arcticus TaxID=1581411 RepID=A0ABT3GJY1_9BACT|nr:hypothetical protein [Luteolibacter arcticus]MCW1923830.1 hypothetical protein [Luteolibacter arcticus]
MELPRLIPYNPKWGVMLMCGAFFGVASGFMGYKAAHNTAGLTINRIITLGPTGATAFYWVISALGAGFVLAAIVAIARRIARPKVLELGTEALLLPHGILQRQTSRIAYADIVNVSEVQVSGQTFLYVTVGGLRYTITASLLPDKETYSDIRAFLDSQAQG